MGGRPLPLPPPAGAYRETATVRRTGLPCVWAIYPDGWETMEYAWGTRAHAERKAHRLLARLNRTRQGFTVTLGER